MKQVLRYTPTWTGFAIKYNKQFTQKYITGFLFIRQVYTFNGDRILHWNSYENIVFTESSVIGIFMASHYYLIELYLG